MTESDQKAPLTRKPGLETWSRNAPATQWPSGWVKDWRNLGMALILGCFTGTAQANQANAANTVSDMPYKLASGQADCGSLDTQAEAEIRRKVKEGQASFNSDYPLTLTLDNCQDLNKDGIWEVIIKAECYFLGRQPTFMIYTQQGRKPRKIAELVNAHSIKVMPQKPGAWPDIFTILYRPIVPSETSFRITPFAQAIKFAWNSQEYLVKASYQDLKAEEALSVFDLPRVVNVQDANVRSAPSIQSVVLNSLARDTMVMASIVQRYENDITWVKIQLEDGQIGWIKSDFLEDRD